jgi:hypothetical protein
VRIALHAAPARAAEAAADRTAVRVTVLRDALLRDGESAAAWGGLRGMGAERWRCGEPERAEQQRAEGASPAHCVRAVALAGAAGASVSETFITVRVPHFLRLARFSRSGGIDDGTEARITRSTGKATHVHLTVSLSHWRSRAQPDSE